MYAKSFIGKIDHKTFNKIRKSNDNAECRRALYELLDRVKDDQCRLGLHPTDFNGKCLLCGEQVFTRESLQNTQQQK